MWKESDETEKKNIKILDKKDVVIGKIYTKSESSFAV